MIETGLIFISLMFVFVAYDNYILNKKIKWIIENLKILENNSKAAYSSMQKIVTALNIIRSNLETTGKQNDDR